MRWGQLHNADLVLFQNLRKQHRLLFIGINDHSISRYQRRIDRRYRQVKGNRGIKREVQAFSLANTPL